MTKLLDAGSLQQVINRALPGTISGNYNIGNSFWEFNQFRSYTFDI